MNRTNGLLASFGVAAVMVIGLACGDGETPAPAKTGAVTASPPASGVDGPSIAPSPISSGTALTQDNFGDLMTIEDVETRLTAKVPLKSEFRDGKDMAGRVDPSQVKNMDSWYVLTITADDGFRGMTFSVIDFDSESSARAHFKNVISETPEMQEMVSPIGEASSQMEVNAQGIGSMLVFIKGGQGRLAAHRAAGRPTATGAPGRS